MKTVLAGRLCLENHYSGVVLGMAKHVSDHLEADGDAGRWVHAGEASSAWVAGWESTFPRLR